MASAPMPAQAGHGRVHGAGTGRGGTLVLLRTAPNQIEDDLRRHGPTSSLPQHNEDIFADAARGA